MFVPGLGSMLYRLFTGVNDRRYDELREEYIALTGYGPQVMGFTRHGDLQREVTRLRAARSE
jgi:hypothetical protein